MDKKILLVDDDQFVLTLLTKMLTDAGYETAQAGDGETAIAMLRDNEYDLVITDIVMPGKNGIELACHVKEREKKIPVLAISSNFDVIAEVNMMGLTSYFADDSLAKPIKKDDLIACVQSLIDNGGALSLYG